jgi:hypothetical protein
MKVEDIRMSKREVGGKGAKEGNGKSIHSGHTLTHSFEHQLKYQ